MLVYVRHMLCQSEVVLRVTAIPDEPKQVKAREQGSWELDVGFGRTLDVVAAERWVGCCQDGHSSIE